MHIQTEFITLLLVIGFIYLGRDGPVLAANDPKCTVVVESVNMNLALSPPSDYCDQSSVEVPNIVRGSCSNNGDDCRNFDMPYENRLYEQFCVAKTTADITGSVTVTGNGCQKTVTYRFTNATECECEFIGYVAT